MKRSIAWLLLIILLVTAIHALGDGELRGYDSKDGYVYVTFGEYPQVIDGGTPDDKYQAGTWRKHFRDHQAKGVLCEEGLDPAAVEPTPILWRVLSVDEEKVFLCSEYILFPMPLDTDLKKYAKVGKDFGQTELCAILNGEFAEKAFTAEEMDMLMERETFGKIFIPSAEELKDKSLGFGTDKARKAWATEYAIRACGAFVYQKKEGNCSPYWTRTQSTSNPQAGRCTKQGGDIGYYSCTNPEEGARPCVWMKTDAYAIAGGSGTKEDPYILKCSTAE